VTDATIFDDPDNGTSEQPKPPASSIPTGLEEIVGEGKKYSSVEDALKSVPHAQKHIQTLEQELAQLKDELVKRKTAQELLDEIKSGVVQPPVEPPQPIGLDQDTLVHSIDQVLEAKERAKRVKENVTSVVNSFKEVHGDSAETVFSQIAKDAGLSIAQLNQLAGTSPAAVLKLAGISNKNTPTSKTQGSINTLALETNKAPSELSAKVRTGATTKDLTAAWHVAGEKVKQKLSSN
jgi:hypothetical protein